MKWLLIHYFLERWREILDGKDAVKNTFKILISLLFVTYLVFMSFFAGFALKKIGESGEIDPFQLFTRFTFYYFLIDILIRFLLQAVPSFNITYYRTLPVKRSSLAHYPLIRSVFSFFNIIPVILFLSVFYQIILPKESTVFSITWIIFFISMIYASNYLGVVLKLLFQKGSILAIGLLVVLGLMLYLEFSGFLEVSASYEKLIIPILGNTASILLPIVLLFSLYTVALGSIQKQFYGDKRDKYDAIGFGKFTRSPAINLLLLELKLIMRNKRPRLNFIFGVFVLIYAGFYLTRLGFVKNEVGLMFFSAFTIGIFALQHGQFLFAWEGSYFDRLVSFNLYGSHFIRSKYYFIIIFLTLGFVLILPYGFLDPRYFVKLSANYLFHLGITTPIMIFSGFFNTTSIDLSKGIFMNYQGVSFNQFLLIIPLALLPTGIFILGEMLDLGIELMAVVGLVGIALTPFTFRGLVAIFIKRRSKMVELYREK